MMSSRSAWPAQVAARVQAPARIGEESDKISGLWDIVIIFKSVRCTPDNCYGFLYIVFLMYTSYLPDEATKCFLGFTSKLETL